MLIGTVILLGLSTVEINSLRWGLMKDRLSVHSKRIDCQCIAKDIPSDSKSRFGGNIQRKIIQQQS